MALTALVALVAQAPTDPYYAAEPAGAGSRAASSASTALAQWVGWLWPYAAIA